MTVNEDSPFGSHRPDVKGKQPRLEQHDPWKRHVHCCHRQDTCCHWSLFQQRTDAQMNWPEFHLLLSQPWADEVPNSCVLKPWLAEHMHFTHRRDLLWPTTESWLRVSKVVLVVKNLPANAGDGRDLGLVSGSGRSPGGGQSNSLQYFCLENHEDRGPWQATVQSRTWLKWFSTHTGF